MKLRAKRFWLLSAKSVLAKSDGIPVEPRLNHGYACAAAVPPLVRPNLVLSQYLCGISLHEIAARSHCERIANALPMHYDRIRMRGAWSEDAARMGVRMRSAWSENAVRMVTPCVA